MAVLLYAALSIVAVNVFAAVVYNYLHRGAGLAISLVGTVLVCIGLTYAALNDVPASKPAPAITADITTPPTTATAPAPAPLVHPSLDPSNVSRGTPSSAPSATAPGKRPAYTEATPRATTKAPVHRQHFDDMEKQLKNYDEGTEPGAGGCDDIAAGGCN